MRIRNQKFFNKRLKYGNKSQVCRQGHKHDSIKESQYCDQLELLRKSGEIKEYQTQVRFDLCVNGQKVCGIIPDFVVTENDGAQKVHEVKSYITMTDAWNIKRKLFESLFPLIEYIVIK